MKHDNKPLTVDQMREMHDKVVIVKTLEYGQESKGILDFSDPNDSDNGVYVGCGFYSVESYGFFWLAYAQKPIDFDDWTAEWKEYTGADAGFHYCSKCGQQAFNYEEDGEVIEVLSNFCPCCGKAMTEFARLLLEKRLSGHNNEQ